ncbi:unnamed protein product [Spirodela intermedia]|uniref:Uncharacterized protein n=1 Tax=Spirodela intermedia TaxID=51605 RepID=A0A7I8IT86_SPIIN|nr:unnamed protein product [Spirodela intermedia]CAA6660355.1 unnamed protein product [Spirodela intermedia]
MILEAPETLAPPQPVCYHSNIEAKLKKKKAAPVEIPQLSTQTVSRGASGFIFARQPTCTTVYSLKVEVPRKW